MTAKSELARDYYHLLNLEMVISELEATIPVTDDPEYDAANQKDLQRKRVKLEKTRDAFFEKYGK